MHIQKIAIAICFTAVLAFNILKNCEQPQIQPTTISIQATELKQPPKLTIGFLVAIATGLTSQIKLKDEK